MVDARALALVVMLAPALPVRAEKPGAHAAGFVSERYETPQLARLKKLYQFDEAAARGSSELQRMLLLKDWIFRALPYRLNYERSGLFDSLRILELAGSGVGFLCTQFSTVHAQLSAAMGWTSRFLYNRNPDGEEHTTNEIWSNQLRKWVYIDCTWNLHVEKSGVPLSALEVRSEWLANRGRSLVFVFGAGPTESRYTSADFPVERRDNQAWQIWPLDQRWVSYTWEMAWIDRNDFFADRRGFWDDSRIYVDGTNSGDTTWGFRRRPAADAPALYHDVNRVDIGLDLLGARVAALRLDARGPGNVTPNFDTFLVRANGGPWRAVDGDTVTVAVGGPNSTVQARVRNKFGVLGPVTTRSLGPGARPPAPER